MTTTNENLIKIDPLFKIPVVDVDNNRYFCTDLLYSHVKRHLSSTEEHQYHFISGEVNVASLPLESDTISFLLDVFEDKITEDNKNTYHRVKVKVSSHEAQEVECLVSPYFMRVLPDLKQNEVCCTLKPINGFNIALAVEEMTTFNFITKLFQTWNHQKSTFS